MRNLNTVTKYILLPIISILLFNNSVSAQMDCRSMLGAHMTPFAKDVPILWGVEGTMAPGIMTSPYTDGDKTQLNGGMLLGALDFSFLKNNHIYFEGGYKNWKNSEFVSDTLESRHVGVRQAFYSYSGDNTKIKLGLHETRLGDFILIDERILGASFDKEAGAFTINARGGTVNQSFARMGKFCANRHLYGVINPNYTEHIGKKSGETNLAGFAISWNPHHTKVVSTTNVDEFGESDEFQDNNSSGEFQETDEFGSNDEFHENHDFNEFGDFEENTHSKQSVSIKNIGIIAYDEFGSDEYIPENKLYVGALIDFDLPFGTIMQLSSIYQNMKENNTLIYIAKLAKSISWDNASNTKISGSVIGKSNIDDGAMFQPLFSNLFIGEVMRMDATEFPLWQAAIKHRFPGKMKFHIAVKAVAQIDDAKTNEQDIEFGMMAFKNHIKATLIGSRMETNLLPEDFYMARLEVRVAF